MKEDIQTQGHLTDRPHRPRHYRLALQTLPLRRDLRAVLLNSLLFSAVLLGPPGCRSRAGGPSPSTTTPETPESAALASAPPQTSVGQNAETICPSYLPARAIGRVESKRLNELSGLAASLKTADVFFTHNDSADEARAYAVSESGALLGIYRLGKRKRAIDIEDIATAESNGRSWLYLADIGDNWGHRDEGVRIDRFEEPDVPTNSADRGTAPSEERVREFESVTLRYPDGPQDAEAFIVDPQTGALVIITKLLTGWARVFVRDRFSSGELRLAGEMTPERTGHRMRYVTGADVSRDGQYLGVRTYTGAYLFRRAPSQPLSAALLGRACVVPTGSEHQGEALALVTPSAGAIPSFVTISEGRRQSLFVSEARTEDAQSK